MRWAINHRMGRLVQTLRRKYPGTENNRCKKPDAGMSSGQHSDPGGKTKSGRCEGEEFLGQIMEALGFVLTVIGRIWKILNKIRVRAQ